MKRFLLALMLVSGCSLWSLAGGDSLRKVAKELGKKIQKMEKPRVGLLSFPYHDGKISSGSSILSERLTTYLAEMKGIRVVERSLLKKILEEQHLSETGVVDANSAQQIGKVLGVDVIVTGTLIDSAGDETELNARVLKSDTGEVLAASRAVVKRSWSDTPKFPRELVRRPTPPPEPEEKPAPNEAIEIGIPAGRGGGYGRRY